MPFPGVSKFQGTPDPSVPSWAWSYQHLGAKCEGLFLLQQQQTPHRVVLGAALLVGNLGLALGEWSGPGEPGCFLRRCMSAARWCLHL